MCDCGQLFLLVFHTCFFPLFSDNKEHCERCATSPTELFDVTEEPVCGNHVDDPCPGQCNGSDYQGEVEEEIWFVISRKGTECFSQTALTCFSA